MRHRCGRLSLTALGLLMALAAPAHAAPAEQANCAYDGMTEQERELSGRVILQSLDGRDAAQQTVEMRRAKTALSGLIAGCEAKHGWTKDEANAAYSYSALRLMAGSAREILEQMGGDPAAADLFFAQNKYKILEEEAAGRSSEEWAKTRLIEMGFAAEKSPAFEAVWFYLGLLFQIDSEYESFISGNRSERAQ